MKMQKFYLWLRRTHLVWLMLAVLLFTLLAPAVHMVASQQRYVLGKASREVAGTSNSALAGKMTFDSKKQLYQFNKDGLAKSQQAADPKNPISKLMQAQTGGADKKDSKQMYSLDLPKKLGDGVTVYDNNLNLSFKLVPEFSSAPGQKRDGRLVYPVDGGQVVYSLKGNGLKEDVLLKEAPKNGNYNMSYKLQLPEELESKNMDDGSIGIYSGDPNLFGDISYGDPGM